MRVQQILQNISLISSDLVGFHQDQSVLPPDKENEGGFRYKQSFKQLNLRETEQKEALSNRIKKKQFAQWQPKYTDTLWQDII